MKSESLGNIISAHDFYNLTNEDIEKLTSGISKSSAIIFNDTGKPVDFYVYNYMDAMCWIPAQNTTIDHGNFGTMTTFGKYFKIHPDKNEVYEFLVAPNRAYIYKGPGTLVHIDRK
ncbi:hypothetical protein F6U93_01100 [Tamlana haliotis]|uniref:Uncharacterized protein n=1 Tax=Pseudotamlana haliotis TaxID=2614804 RepID=A0A6N6MMJ0_9FLAO|nr:hypothetical protein [Tamlana haliotis]KAB1071353.1 hypothetical protein F6U93_01100 [Tamlana haliotis]